jgi:hypothetical protein
MRGFYGRAGSIRTGCANMSRHTHRVGNAESVPTLSMRLWPDGGHGARRAFAPRLPDSYLL